MAAAWWWCVFDGLTVPGDDPVGRVVWVGRGLVVVCF